MIKKFYSDDKQNWVTVDTEKGFITEVGSNEGFWNGLTPRKNSNFAIFLSDAICTLSSKTRNNLKFFCTNDLILKSIYEKKHNRLQKEANDWKW